MEKGDLHRQFSSNSFSKVILNEDALGQDILIGRLDENTDSAMEDNLSNGIYWASDGKWYFKWNLKTGEKTICDLSNDPQCMKNVEASRQSEVSYFSAKVLEWRQNYEGWKP